MFGVELPVSACVTSRRGAGIRLEVERDAPATCGVAIEVPLMVFVAVSLVFQAEVMLEPGAKMSRHVPKLENDERASVLVVEPTVIGRGDARRRTVAGVRVRVARGDGVGDAGGDRVVDGGVERGAERRRRGSCSPRPASRWLAVTQSMPAITPALVPEPAAVQDADRVQRDRLATP